MDNYQEGEEVNNNIDSNEVNGIKKRMVSSIL